MAYVKEREKAIEITNEGGVSPNEQLVWVLWKILKGDGNDVSLISVFFGVARVDHSPHVFPDRTLFPKYPGTLAFTTQT